MAEARFTKTVVCLSPRRCLCRCPHMRDTRLNLALQYQRLSSRLNADIACHKLHAKRIKATAFESLPSPQILNNNQGKPDYMTVIMAPNYNLSALQASVFFLINTESQPFLRVISTGGTGGRFGACCIVIFLSVCDCHRENKKKKGGVGGRGGGKQRRTPVTGVKNVVYVKD